MTDNEKAARKKKIMHAVMWVVLLLLFLCFVAPFILVVINVFKTKADITSNPLALIGKHGFTMKNFPEAMKKMNFWRVFGNSAIITITSTILTILVSSMASFVIVRNQKWPACALMFSAMVASMVIPFQVLMVPLVSVYGGTFGVLNHRLTLILMHVGDGDIHVPRIYSHEYSAGTRGSRSDRRLYALADILADRIPAS